MGKPRQGAERRVRAGRRRSQNSSQAVDGSRVFSCIPSQQTPWACPAEPGGEVGSVAAGRPRESAAVLWGGLLYPPQTRVSKCGDAHPTPSSATATREVHAPSRTSLGQDGPWRGPENESVLFVL